MLLKRKQVEGIGLTFFMLFPFVPISAQVFNTQVYYAFILWKITVLATICFHYILLKKLPIDKLEKAVLISLIVLMIPTIIHDGNASKYFGFVFDSYGIIMIFKYLDDRYGEEFYNALKHLVRSVIYLNFIGMVIFPEGVFVGYSMQMRVRYNYLGMDNQAAAIVVPFMAILFALNMSKGKKITLFGILDVIISLATLIMLWSATALVGTAVFIAIIFYRYALKKKVSLKSGLIFIAVSFVLIVFFRIYRFMSFIIVNILGKGLGLTGRVQLWASAIRTWLQYPILGHGIQDTESLVYFSIMNDYRHSHNQYLQILVNGGICYMISFVYILRTIQKKVDKKINNSVCYIFSAGIIAYLFMCIADSYGHLVGLYYLIAAAYYYRIQE